MKSQDMHRERFATGDWTDDSDQMILILLSLVENDGKVMNFNDNDDDDDDDKDGYE